MTGDNWSAVHVLVNSHHQREKEAVPVTPAISGTEYLKQLAAQAHTAKPQEPSCDLKSALRSEVEAWLNKFGVKWTGPVSVPLSQIDRKESRDHNSRETAIVEDTVQGVMTAIDGGEYIKPIVGYVDGSKLHIVDGNNRDEAHLRKDKSLVESYILDAETPSAIIAEMLVDANAHHPARPDLSFRVRQAARLIAAFGVPKDRACLRANVTKTQLETHLKTVEADARAAALKIRDWKTVSETGRRALHRITMDAPFHAAARVAIESKMTSQEIDTFSKDIRSAGKSETAMLHVVEHVKQQRIINRRAQEAGVSSLAMTASANLSTALGKLQKVDPVQLAQTVLTDHDRRLLLERIEAAVDHLGTLEAAITVKAKAV